MVRIDEGPGAMDLPFMLVPDEHGQDCAQYFDIGGYMRKITAEDFANDVFSQQLDGSRSHETFLDLIGESSESRDYLRHLADGRHTPTRPNPGDLCDFCSLSFTETGFEVYSELSDTEVIRWFSENRPDLIYTGLIVRSDDWNPEWEVMLRLLHRTLINFRVL